MNAKLKNRALFVYWIAIFLFTIVISLASFYYKPNIMLSFAAVLYWAVAILPIALTNFNWIHPLIFQLLFEIPKVFSFATRAVGYIPLNDNWVISVTVDDCADAYLQCVLITCIGLLIEYAVIFKFQSEANNYKEIHLKYNQTGILLFLFAIISFYYMMSALGGITYVILNFQDRLTEFSEDRNLYLRYFVSYGIISTLYFYVTGRTKMVYICAFIQMLMYTAMGERGGLITLLIFPLFICYQLRHGHVIKTKYLVVGFIALVLLYEGFGMLRDLDMEVNASSLVSNIVDTFAHETHFVISAELLYLMNQGSVDFLWGAPLLNIFVAPFPRSLFPWKPTFIADSALVGSLILNREENVFGMPPGNFMWGYLNFGIIGVVAFSIVSALAMKWLYGSFVEPYLEKHRPTPSGNILIYVLFVGELAAILSTEVQIKIIVLLVGLSVILFGTRIKTNDRKQ